MTQSQGSKSNAPKNYDKIWQDWALSFDETSLIGQILVGAIASVFTFLAAFSNQFNGMDKVPYWLMMTAQWLLVPCLAYLALVWAMYAEHGYRNRSAASPP